MEVLYLLLHKSRMESLFKMREKPDTPNRRFKEVRRLFNKAKQETDIKHLTLAHQIPNQKELVEMTNYDPINESIGIYMDTINIFIRMASIFAGGNRKK